jgi:hypothetical protein
MQCPNCYTEFKNYNSLRVHNYRFHNPATKYRRRNQTSFYGTNDFSDPALGLPAAAALGLTVASSGGWKKWLVLLLVLLGVVFVTWYVITKDSEKAN